MAQVHWVSNEGVKHLQEEDEQARCTTMTVYILDGVGPVRSSVVADKRCSVKSRVHLIGISDISAEETDECENSRPRMTF